MLVISFVISIFGFWHLIEQLSRLPTLPLVMQVLNLVGYASGHLNWRQSPVIESFFGLISKPH